MKNIITRRWVDWFLLVFISFIATLWLQAPRLIDYFKVDGDFRTFYWMNHFQDSALFLDVPAYIPIYILGIEWPFMLTSPGYGFLFYIASFIVSPVLFSKILAFAILPIAMLYLFEFGRITRGRETGFLLALAFMLLILASPSSTSIIPGLQRSFAVPLIIALVYYLHREKYVGAAIATVVSTLIYPPMFMLGAITWALYVIRIRWKPSLRLTIKYRALGILLGTALIGAAIMAPVVLPRVLGLFDTRNQPSGNVQTKDTQTESNPILAESYKYLWDNPRYRTGGQYPLFFLFPLVGRGGLVNNGEDGVHILVLLSLSVLIFLVRRRKAFDLPYVIWCVFWASLISFVLSWMGIWLTNSFVLYLPSRYTRIGLFLFFLVFVVWNAKDAVAEAIVFIRRNPKSLQWIVGVVGILVLALVFLYPSELSRIGGFNMKWLLVPTALIFTVLAVAVIRRPASTAGNVSTVRRVPGGRLFIGLIIAVFVLGWAIYAPIVSGVDFLDPPPEERALLEFLETLPKDVLLAGTPIALDNVPLFAKRQVLFNHDVGGANSTTIREALAAYYSDDPHAVVDFCQEYNVDYLVIDTQAYTQDYLSTQKIYFEPYNQELMPRVIKQGTFLLAEIPASKLVYTSGPYRVIKCDADTILANN
ncbi:MAG: hypothetical protein GY797_35085 [Deltaproteobacteria bacterium]|nr:hypothetical protein [Deltaproteobacteria bacterium]